MLVDFLTPARFECLTSKEISSVQAVLKLTKGQVILAYECLKLLQAPSKDESLHKPFRLMVGR